MGPMSKNNAPRSEKKYGPLTAIAMVVGTVIGSGIFFKSDDVLLYTGGSIPLGVLVFCIAAISIVFGSLSIGEMAARTDKPGGIITYAQEFCSSRVSCAFGWFHTFIYYPTLIAVVSWVIGIYSCMLFGFEGTLETQILIGTLGMAILFLINTLWTRFGGLVQGATTILKLLPLFLFAFCGLIFGNPSEIHTPAQTLHSAGWLAAIAPVAFAFDGWIVSTSIAHEIKNSKRNLPLALVIAPVFILLSYVLYFVGMSLYLGPQQLAGMGDAHLYAAAQKLLGPWGAKIILIFVIISVAGTVNGLVMGNMRNPYSLALRNMIPASRRVSQISEKYGLSLASVAIAFVLSAFWMLIHYLTQKFSLLGNSDVSEISIVMNYLAYIILYFQVMRMARRGTIKNRWRGYGNPALAILGSCIILYGGIQNAMFLLYGAVSLVMMGCALWYYHRHATAIQMLHSQE